MPLRGGDVNTLALKDLEDKQKIQSRSAGSYVFSKVTRIIDGDTFDVDSGDVTRIRLQGVDAPEIATQEGRAAKEGMKQILSPGDMVRLSNIETQSGTTAFGERIVALVYIGNTLVNQEIVRQGWAVPTSHLFNVPSKEAYAITDALEEAKRMKRGLWRKFPGSDFLKPFNLVGEIGEFPEIDDLERFSKIPGATKVGTIWLYVPPTQINITEHNANQELPLVRAPGSARIKTSQREQRIEMYVIFPNRWAINYQFRAILAQFIRSPFLPLENEHIEDLLLPSYAIPDDYTFQEPPGEKAYQKSKIKKAVEDEKGLNQDVGDVPGRIAQGGMNSYPKPSKIKIRDRQLFVALRNMVVSTIPGKPDGLQVTFVLSVFNYLPNASKVEYLKTMGDVVKQAMYFDKLAKLKFPDGDPKSLDSLRQGIQATTDISKSEPFKRYYRTLLAEGNTPEVDSHLMWDKRITPRLVPFLQERLDDITFRLKTNLLPTEMLQQNMIDITALSEEISRRLLTELEYQARSPIEQLATSISAGAKIFKDFFNWSIHNASGNLEKALSSRDNLVIQFGEYFDASKTNILTSVKQSMVPRNADAEKLFKAAAGRALRDPKILQLMKEVLITQQKNKTGTKGEVTVHLSTDAKTVIAAVNATYSPTIVPIPVLDHPNPSMQFFGKSDWMVSINIQTCDRTLVEKMMELNQKSRLNRMIQNDVDNWYLAKLTAIEVGFLENNSNGFFNALGINRVLLEDLTYETVQGKPGWFNMTARFVQADLDIAEYERLVRTNFVSNKAQKQILRNIRDNGVPASSKTGTAIKAALDHSTRQVITGMFQGLFDNELSTEQVDAIIAKGAAQRMFIENIDNPSGWDKAVREIFMSDVVNRNDMNSTMARLFGSDQSPNIVINPPIEGPIDISAIVDNDAKAIMRTPLLFKQRISFSRILFQMAMNAEVNRQIAMIRGGTDEQKKELVTLYDPTSLGNVDDAIRRVTFEGELGEQSFLHGCYPDLELPIYIRNPYMISPDFFYRRDERTPSDVTDIVEKRLNRLFQIASANLQNYTDGPYDVPESVISDIRSYIIWKKNKSSEIVAKLSNKTLNMTAEEIAKMAEGIVAPTEAETLAVIKEIEAGEYSKVPIDSMIQVRRLALLTDIAATQDIVSSAPQILGKDIPKEYVEILRRNQVDKVAEFNAMPMAIAQGAINGLWGAMTPSNIIKNWHYLRQTAKFRVNRARSEEAAGSLARSYPTAKIYFIEEDAKEWGQLDDYYSYQSLRSVQVVASKEAASRVATIQLSNITKKLSDQRATLGENKTQDQTDQEQVLQSFVLREGMTIMVKMGYSNDPDLLERVFIGKIVSVSQGEVIQVVAQSFGAELTGPIFNGQELKLGYLFSSARSLGDVMVQAMGSMDGLEHFGNRSWLDILKLRIPKLDQMGFQGLAYSNPKYRRWDYYKALVNPISRLVEFGVYDPRLENAFAPFTGNIQTALTSAFWLAVAPMVNATKAISPQNAFGNLKKLTTKNDVAAVAPPDLTKVSPETIKGLVTHPTFDWYVPNGATMWGLMQEMTLYFNDYITTVLPYNDDMSGMQRETIYFGPRNGLYKYTEKYDNQEVTKEIFSKNKNGRTEMMVDIQNPEHLVDDSGVPLPGYMPVVNYHWVDSYHDILENGIVASAERIHNKVTIRFPGEPGKGADNEFTVVADDNIKEGNIRHLVSEQPNIDPAAFEDFYNTILKPFAIRQANNASRLTAQAANITAAGVTFGATTIGPGTATTSPFTVPDKSSSIRMDSIDLPTKYTVSANVLANEMRKMYGGALKIWGRPSIKPYDTVYLNDSENVMFGPIEVDEVVHDFNSETGFSTTITPSAMISIRDQTKLYHDIAMNGLVIPYVNKSFTGLFSNDKGKSVPQTSVDPDVTLPPLTPDKIEYRKAVEAFMNGDKAGAFVYAKRAYQINPSNLEAKRMIERLDTTPVPETRPESKKRYVQALEAYLRKDLILAETLANEAVSMDPNNREAKRMGERLAMARTSPAIDATISQKQPEFIEASMTSIMAAPPGITAAGALASAVLRNPNPLTVATAVTAGALAVVGMGYLWSKGLARVMGRDIINVTGLFYNGVPFVAGMEGAYKDSYRVHFEDWVTNLVTFSASQETFGTPLELR